MQDQTIRRLGNGSIDYNHYLREGRRCRAQTQRELFSGRRGIVRPLVALAAIFAPLAVAALVHEFKGGAPNLANTSPAVATSIERNVHALNRSRGWWERYGQRGRDFLIAGR